MKKSNLFKSFAFIILVFCCINANAQLDSCNAFIKGNYVEVGVNWNGSYGSSVLAPAGYHATTSYMYPTLPNSTACDTVIGKGLGFICDIDKDGWTVGTPPFYGDYFIPGYPQEGWSIFSSGVQANAWNGPGGGRTNPATVCDAAITGSNVAYFTTSGGSRRITVWRGFYDSIQITQVTSVDTGNLFFTTHVKFKNLGHVTRSNVYYLRTIDPDNDVVLSGDFTTKNKIESNYPGATPLISTWGTHYSKSYLALTTLDTPAKAFVIKRSLTPTHRIDSIYNGLDTTVLYTDSLTSDVGVGIVFKIHSLAPIDSSVIAFAYAFKKGVDLDSALVSTTRTFPLDTVGQITGVGNINSSNQNNITIYPNPVKDGMTITGVNPSDQLTIFDMMGRKVKDVVITTNGNNTFNTANLIPGVYILRVIDNDGNIKARIPMQKL